ncbi:kinase-like domain-containing protein [Hysterangium stoloniferum]|nr:kinase-like domain-containing protein [Hysterangium stoloniferum]
MLFTRFPVTLKFRSRRAETCSEQTIDFDSEVNLFHYELQRIIGKGTYGRVRVVKHRKTGGLFALKYVDKHQCLKSGISANVVQERRLLENIRHPFIVNMHQAFQDPINCYFILDLMLGGHLGFHRLRMGSLSENSVRFFVAEISSALAYLHQNGICHRDVKPENILLDAQGHAHLTDFNVAIRYSTEELHTEVAGTMVYMAPEVLQRHGYSWQIDYWSLGVTAFECLFHGQRPFADKCRSVEILRKSIMTDTLVFPSEPKISQDGTAAIAMLLERDPSKRLGCQYLSRVQGQTQLRSHRWFRKIDWRKLDSKKLSPPFVPDNRVSNFEEPSVDDALHRRRRITINLDKKSPDLQYLEQRYAQQVVSLRQNLTNVSVSACTTLRRRRPPVRHISHILMTYLLRSVRGRKAQVYHT